MFGKLKNMFGAKDAAVMILAPVEGEVVPVTQVSDPTFGEEILGKGWRSSRSAAASLHR